MSQPFTVVTILRDPVTLFTCFVFACWCFLTIGHPQKFVVGVDRAKMRLYDCEQKAQDDIVDSGQEEEYNDFKQKPKKSFAEFKF